MKINDIHIKNILSYKNERIELNKDLNIIVGANGSGKSNLINIIIYVLKRFCMKNYEISLTRGIEMVGYGKYVIREKSPLYGDSEDHFLEKNKKYPNEERVISLTIQFEHQDVKNIDEFSKYKKQLQNFIKYQVESTQFYDEPYSVQIDEVAKFFDIKYTDFKIGEKIEIKVKENNGKFKIVDIANEKYLLYMKFFSLMYELLNLMGIEHNIKNPFVFFEAYRNNSNETTKVGIAKYENHSYANMQSIHNIKSLAYSIGNRSSYIMLATKKFGKMLRLAIEEPDGREKFERNEEYKKLREFFKKFNYDINVKCIDYEDNIYQFFVIKNGVSIEIDEISSGEREIINFIFGLFLEEIKDGIVIIDEPELHLHPNWQKKLIDVLKSETKNNNIQVMFVTHSASFINYNLLNNIYRIYMDKDGCSKHIKINNLIKEDEEDIRKKLNIINATNNEKIFFSKAVILVEGITDVIVFKKIFEMENCNVTDIEFVNINGKNNLNNFTDILDKMHVQWFYIGDYDNLKNFGETEKYFKFDTKNAKDDLKTKNKSYYCMDLLNQLELFSKDENYDVDKLKSSYLEYKENVSSISENLSDNEKNIINEFIEKKYEDNIYILKEGEIEDYLEVGSKSKAKGFDKAIRVTTSDEEFNKVAMNYKFNELTTIIKDICNKIQ